MNVLPILLLIVCAALQFSQGAQVTFAPGAITYGNGTFVGVSNFDNKNRIYHASYSKDGVTWQDSTINNPPKSEFNPSIIYINASFFIYWTDWLKGSSVYHVSYYGNEFSPMDILYPLGSKYLMLTSGIGAAIESDWKSVLVTWTGWLERRNPLTNSYNGFESAASVFILLDNNAADGPSYNVSQTGYEWITWKISDFGKGYRTATFFTGKTKDEIVAFVSKKYDGTDPDIFTSNDLGKTWQQITSDLSGTPTINVYACGYYVTVLKKLDILISKDLMTWQSTPHPFAINDITSLVPIEDRLFVTLKQGYAVTKDLVDWTVPTGN